MSFFTRALIGAVAGTLISTGALADVPSAAHAPTPFLPVANEPAPKLFVDPPLAEPLATRGAVIIPYQTENFRILPIFGPSAADVSPRAGHLHVTVDNLPWHWADVSDTHTVVVVGLPAGEHKITIELAGPDHKVFTGQTVIFTVPELAAHAH